MVAVERRRGDGPRALAEAKRLIGRRRHHDAGEAAGHQDWKWRRKGLKELNPRPEMARSVPSLLPVREKGRGLRAQAHNGAAFRSANGEWFGNGATRA